MMSVDVTTVCRVCLAEGARNIFEKNGANNTSSGAKISSLENLLEKMRYVTMVQIRDNDNLPKMICDMCIVSLNVSYHFKRQAVEHDVKLRQYLIEKGISEQSQVSTTTITPSIIYSSNISVIQNQNRVNVLPIAIKTEITDGDNEMTEVIADDITEVSVDVNSTTTLFPPPAIPRQPQNNASEKSKGAAEKNVTTIAVRKATPSPTPSMVIINDNIQFDSINARSPERKTRDTEFINNYIAKAIQQTKTKNNIPPLNNLPETPSTSTHPSPPSEKSARIPSSAALNLEPSARTTSKISSTVSTAALTAVETNPNDALPKKVSKELRWIMKLSLDPNSPKLRKKKKEAADPKPAAKLRKVKSTSAVPKLGKKLKAKTEIAKILKLKIKMAKSKPEKKPLLKKKAASVVAKKTKTAKIQVKPKKDAKNKKIKEGTKKEKKVLKVNKK